MGERATTARRRAREVAFRVVYQADVLAEPVTRIWREAHDAERLSDDQRQLVDDVVRVLEARADEVDETLRRAAERWELPRLAATDRSVLRSAVAELIGRPGTPVRVVLNEAIEIAKRFGSDESGRFVNGVLDRVAHELRPGEL